MFFFNTFLDSLKSEIDKTCSLLSKINIKFEKTSFAENENTNKSFDTKIDYDALARLLFLIIKLKFSQLKKEFLFEFNFKLAQTIRQAQVTDFEKQLH